MDLQRSLIVWLNNNELSRSTAQLSDLSDGVMLYELLSQLVPDYFPATSMLPDPKGSLAVKISNLRRVNSNLEFYLTQVMNLPVEDPVDVSKIARNSDQEQLMKLLELVVSVAVQCQQKEKVISRILQLPEACQHELMLFIKNILERSRRRSISTDPSDLNKLKQLNQELVREVENLNLELTETRKEHELFRARMEKMLDEKPPEKSTLTAELEGRLTKEMDLTQELTRQLTDLKRQYASEVGELRDELDIANERILQLSKLEPAIEKLKAKNEEASAIKKKLHEVNTEYEALQEKMRIFEEQHSADIQVHEALSIFKEQFSQEKSRSMTLSLRIESLTSELRDTQKHKAEAFERSKLLEAKTHQLNEQIASMLHRERHEEVSFASDIAQSEPAAPARVSQQTIEALQKHFNEQLDNLLRDKILVEEKYKSSIEEIDNLRQHPVTREDQETKAILRVREEEISTLAEQKSDLMQRLEQVSNELKKVDSVLAENERLRQEKENLMLETAKIYREKDEIGQKIIEYKDSVLRHLTELVERDKLIAQLREENFHFREQIRDLQEKLAIAPEPTLPSDPSETPEQLKNITEALKKLTENKDLSMTLRVREEEISILTEQKNDLIQRLEQVSAELKKVDTVLVDNERLRRDKENLMTESAKIYREKDELGQKMIEYKDSVLMHMTELVDRDKLISQLREEVYHLKEQAKELQKHFNEQLDHLLREKLLAEEKCKQALEESESLRQHPVIVQLEDQESKQQLKQKEEELALLTTHKADLQHRFEQASFEVKRLEGISTENEKLKLEKESMMNDYAKVHREKDEASQRIAEYKDSVLRHLTELVERDKTIAQLREDLFHLREQTRELQERHHHSSPDPPTPPVASEGPELKNISEALKKLTENGDLSQLLKDKSDYETLKKQHEHLQTELSRARQDSAELSSVKAKLQEMEKSKSQAENLHKKTLSEMEVDLGSKDQRMRDAELRERELRKLMSDEEKLMAIAIHELGLAIFQQHAERNGALKPRS